MVTRRYAVGAHYGLFDWLAQRVTAIVMALYALLLVGVALVHGGIDYPLWRALFAHGGFRIASFLVMAALLYHAWVGMRDILMDYVKPTGARLALSIARIVELVGEGGARGDVPHWIQLPKGRKTTDKTAVSLTAELQQIKGMLQALTQLIGGLLPLTYLVLDGHFGNNGALQMTRQCHLHLISKLRADSALYLRYDGPYAGRGPRRIYGDKINYRAIPDKYLKQVSVVKAIESRTYHMEVLHRAFAQPLNVVIIVKTHRQTGPAPM